MKRQLIAGLIIMTLGSLLLTTSTNAKNLSNTTQLVQMASACTLPSQKGITNKIFVPWYKYLEGDDSSGQCVPTLGENSNSSSLGLTGASIVAILVAILELLINISAIVATCFIIYGSVQYITSQGSEQGINSAKSTIANALVGFAVALLATAIVQFVGRTLS